MAPATPAVATTPATPAVAPATPSVATTPAVAAVTPATPAAVTFLCAVAALEDFLDLHFLSLLLSQERLFPGNSLPKKTLGAIPPPALSGRPRESGKSCDFRVQLLPQRRSIRYVWPALIGEGFVLITKASDAGLVCAGDPSIMGTPPTCP
ncbi:MAG: hypothetical protein JO115_08565 [Pseudonocardiales bacterium]|nr:hypothetical protein [Pseudonocardiales bacterium]